MSYRSTRTVDITPVTGDTMPLSYAAALSALTDYGIDYGQPFDADSPDAVVVSISRSYSPAAGMWTFTAGYGDSDDGENFLAKPPLMRYQAYRYPRVYDHDVNNVPFQNSAGTPFSEPMEREMHGVIVTVRRPAADYDFVALLPYFGKLNATDLLLPDGNYVPARCAKFEPVEMAFKDTSQQNRWLDFKFDCRVSPWEWRKNVIDRGAEGWGIDPADVEKRIKGVFTTDNPAAGPAGEVLLRGDGKPINTAFSRVVEPTYSTTYSIAYPPGANPTDSVVSPHISAGGLSTYDGTGTTGLVVLSFQLYETAELNDLMT
ncbi:MAG: hypothetical protein QM754_10705 [Tepidisphaeraceae bacterium]